MENNFLNSCKKKKKNHMKQLLKLAKIMTAQKVIYWIMNISKIINN